MASLITPADRQAWRKWLEAHHADSPGIWLVYYKKHTGRRTISYDEAVEEALCFGWIDSKPNTIDDERYKQWFTPRKPRSVWAESNKRRVARLKRAGRMTAAGLAAVALAKRNGSWTSLNPIEALTIPADLKKALAANPQARSHFQAFPDSRKKAILYWILSAKRTETRERRIAETVRLAEANIRAQEYSRS